MLIKTENSVYITVERLRKRMMKTQNITNNIKKISIAIGAFTRKTIV